jgi:superfamily II DNA/RNA helicase
MKITQEKLLSNLGIEALNPMQEAALKTINREASSLIIAPTGSGKTLAYLLPLVHLLKADIKTVQCLVLVPSRELAIQIEQVWKKMGTGFKVNVCYGGHSVQTEINNLSNPPALLIGTPGRIYDHLTRRSFEVNSITTLILDEFDKSLEMGFEEEMGYILKTLKKLDKKVLVSATKSLRIPDFVNVIDPVTIDFTKEKATEDLALKMVYSDDKDKLYTLFNLLCAINSEPALIFSNHRDGCERITAFLNEKGIDTAYYHGGLEQDDRERALIRFRNGSVNYLVTTDLAARGLDIPEMKHVIHYQLPVHQTEFTHRNGRTARMKAKGTAYILLFKEEEKPNYLTASIPELKLLHKNKLPEAPLFQTIYIAGGKKNKLSKMDIVGTFIQKGKLAKDDVGLIEVKDFSTFVAIKKTQVPALLKAIKDEKIKGKKYKVEVAR